MADFSPRDSTIGTFGVLSSTVIWGPDARKISAPLLTNSMRHRSNKGQLEQFQEKCEAVFRTELRKNKNLERFCVSMKG
ncbi:hypothetical protein GFL93_21375 [Rhizobium leguminosarum bv. viciae]|uniref:Uncharacterized protein n=1 Tax=Rhizobium leguminosarum bv. viciae TaxID=387 RepID=A0A8G2J0V3_RHILV|nr:hypothetical protein [Rhizobium leguminosarum bv. viciae]NKK22132.1 hypothetical protein [Rhizobium leguminosarum bv. viciae]TBX93741.1 hypothetical protein E0H31_14585 [Rhizobium leguminosarum bv. viciae]TBZ17204.1 hypothetical protein E0H52_20015 [Rhizobium leguminosarum bv. viciae]